MTLIYKICTESEWAEAVRLGCYRGSADDHRDGFIHLSDASQVTETFRRHFAARQNLLVFSVDDTDLGDSIRWEPSRGGALFPHLYADIPLMAVRQVAPLTIDTEGRVQLP